MATPESPQRHLQLLIFLLLIFVASPFVMPYYYGPTILNIIAAAVLLSATYAVSRRRSFFIFAISVSIFSIALTFWLAAFGYAWTFAYSVIETVQPGSFISLSSPAPHDLISSVMQLRYFSFVTLATVGYGDIVPHTPAARTMALLEAILGQFYLVALVGRLVGLHIVHGNEPRAAD